MHRTYVAAGHVLASHSWSHPHLSALSAADYLADVDRGWGFLKHRKGVRPWFRFPYLDEGGPDKAKRDAVRAGLEARGIQNGYVTVDGSDWNMEALAVAAMQAGKPIDLAALLQALLKDGPPKEPITLLPDRGPPGPPQDS